MHEREAAQEVQEDLLRGKLPVAAAQPASERTHQVDVHLHRARYADADPRHEVANRLPVSGGADARHGAEHRVGRPRLEPGGGPRAAPRLLDVRRQP